MYVVDAVEDIASGVHRQCRDRRVPAVLGYRRDAGSYANTGSFKLTQFLHRRKDLLTVGSFGVEHGLGVVEDYEDLRGGEEWP